MFPSIQTLPLRPTDVWGILIDSCLPYQVKNGSDYVTAIFITDGIVENGKLSIRRVNIFSSVNTLPQPMNVGDLVHVNRCYNNKQKSDTISLSERENEIASFFYRIESAPNNSVSFQKYSPTSNRIIFAPSEKAALAIKVHEIMSAMNIYSISGYAQFSSRSDMIVDVVQTFERTLILNPNDPPSPHYLMEVRFTSSEDEKNLQFVLSLQKNKYLKYFREMMRDQLQAANGMEAQRVRVRVRFAFISLARRVIDVDFGKDSGGVLILPRMFSNSTSSFNQLYTADKAVLEMLHSQIYLPPASSTSPTNEAKNLIKDSTSHTSLNQPTFLQAPIIASVPSFPPAPTTNSIPDRFSRVSLPTCLGSSISSSARFSGALFAAADPRARNDRVPADLQSERPLRLHPVCSSWPLANPLLRPNCKARSDGILARVR
jgi:hypothetical protein